MQFRPFARLSGLPALAGVAPLLAALALPVSALTLDFEDLPAGTDTLPGTPTTAGVQLSAPYHGFVFRFFNGLRDNPADPGSRCAGCEGSWSYSDAPILSTSAQWIGSTNTSVSTDAFEFPLVSNAARNLSYDITTEAPILLKGLTLIATFQPVTVELMFYDGATLVGRSGSLALTQDNVGRSIPLTWSSAAYLDPSSTPVSDPGGVAINRLVVAGPQGYFAMDDLQYELVAVPEPASAALLLAGMAGVLALTRAQRRAQPLRP